MQKKDYTVRKGGDWFWILQIIFLSGTSLLQPIKIGSPMPLNF